MSCDHELANEWARSSGKNASYITTLVITSFTYFRTKEVVSLTGYCSGKKDTYSLFERLLVYVY